MAALLPGQRKQITLTSGTIEYLEVGPAHAPPLLFIHGVLANDTLWHHVAQRLTSFRCIVPTWPLGAHRVPMAAGADLSPTGMVQVIVEFIDALGLKRVTLVGNDSGGALCQMLVARHPERVERLVLTSCDAYEIWLPRLFKYIEFAAFIPGMLWVLGQTMRWRFLRTLPMAFGWLAKRMPRDVSDATTLPLAQSSGVRRDVAKFLRGISARHTLAAATQFGSFTAPVLIAWSREDRFFPLRHANQLQRDFQQARLVFIDDAYTFSGLDNPLQLAASIERFLLDFAALL